MPYRPQNFKGNMETGSSHPPQGLDVVSVQPGQVAMKFQNGLFMKFQNGIEMLYGGAD